VQPEARSPIRFMPPQWLALLGALLFLGLYFVWIRYDAKQLTEAMEKERLLAQTRVLSFLLEKNMAAANAILVTQAQEWEANKDGQAASQRLKVLESAVAGLRSLQILDKNGTSLASSNQNLLGRNFSEREYFVFFKEGTERDMLFVSPPFRSILGTIVVVLARPMFDKSGALSGVVSATVDPDFFVPLLKAVRTTPDTRVAIAHGEGRLFIVEPARTGSQLMNLDVPDTLFRLHKESGKTIETVAGRLAVTGENGYWSFSTVRPLGLKSSAPLVVLAGRSFESIHKAWRLGSLLLAIGYLFVAVTSCTIMHLYMRRKQKLELQLQESARALEAKARFIRSVTDGVPGLIGYWDAELRCQFANQAYLEWFGKSPDQLVGIAMQDLLGEELFRLNQAHIYAALWGEPQTFERTLKKADGSVGNTLARYIPDKQGDTVQGFFVLISDVTEMKQAQAKLESLINELNTQAVTDGLTGLANRRHFWEQSTVELKRTKRHGFELCLVMLDIDKFKTINDGYGHAAGDEVLRRLAKVMKTALRETDVAGRLGGEEFGVLLPQTGETEAQIIAERLRQAVMATEVTFEASTIRFTVSLGLAAAWRNEHSVDDLMKRADMALYRAKETGRNRVCLAAEND